MFDDDGGMEVDRDVATAARPGEEPWQELHQRLRSIAKRRIALEAEETRWLVEAYMERELHWGPHAARERLRVARRPQTR